MAERERHEHYYDPEYNGSYLFITAQKKRDDLAAIHSITSSARSRIDGGTVSPSAVAVLRFTTISNLVGSCTGRSPGFSPR